MSFSLIHCAKFNQSNCCLPSDARGRQCVPICVMYLMFVKKYIDIHTVEVKHLHDIMYAGSLLYCAMRQIKGNVLDLVDPGDLPQCICFQGNVCYLKHRDFLTGYLSRTDQTDNLNVHTLNIAFTKSLTHLRNKYFILIFNGMSLGILYQNQHFYIFDSHSRDVNGLSCSDGFCVLGSVLSVNAVCEHVLQLVMSCGVDINCSVPFALHVIDFLKNPDPNNPRHNEPTVTIDLETSSFYIGMRGRKKRSQPGINTTILSSKRQKHQTYHNNGCSFLECVDDLNVPSNADTALFLNHEEPEFTQKNIETCLKGRHSFLECVDDINVPSNTDTNKLFLNHEDQDIMQRDYEIFRNLIQTGPDYVCSCCTQTYFCHSVSDVSRVRVVTHLKKYITGYCSFDGKEWICCSCLKAVKKGNVPQFWIKNGLEFPKKPNELSLSNLEERLVSPRLPFMQMREMPRGGQINLKGNIVNVPADVTSTIKKLPRMVSDTETIMVKLKRRLSYKHHVAFENIRPNKVMEAAEWLVYNSPIFRSEGIVVDEHWLDNPENSSYSFESESDAQMQSCDQEEDNWTDLENYSDRPTGNQDTFLQSIDFREFNQILCLAPGENSSPIGLFQDFQSEVLSFPTIFCGVKRKENCERIVPLHYSSICKWELRNVDRRVAMSVPNIFFKLKRLQIKQLRDKVTLAIRKCKVNDKKFTAGEILAPDFVQKITMQNDGYRILRNIRGSPPYWEQAKRDVFAMIRQLGIPTWFCSFSAAETKWYPLLKSLSKLVNGKDISEKEAQSMTWQEKSLLIKSDPVTCARYFDYRVQSFIKHVLRSKLCPVGDIVDYFYRVEFQQRGSPHIHMLIWIKNAPVYGKSENSQITAFIDKYVTCFKDVSISEFVNYQTHRHAKTCRTKGMPVCRFNFPLPPMPETVILEPLDQMYKSEQHKQTYDKIMNKLSDINGDTDDMSFSDFLNELNLTYEAYLLALRSQLTRSRIFLKRSLSESRINNYNTVLMKNWQANMDIQFVLDPYACVSYIVSYISKGQRGLSNLLHDACSQARENDSDIRQQVRRIGNQFLSNVEIGAQEAVYLVLQMPLRRATREVIFVDSQKPENRTTLIKPFSDLKNLPKNSTNTETDSVIKRYKRRPKVMDSLCYADFASWFELCPSPKEKPSNVVISEQELPETDYDHDKTDDIDAYDSESNNNIIKFACGTSMRKRTKQKVIYSHTTTINSNREEHFREKLMLYYNWRDEEKDLLDGFESYESSYHAKHDIVQGNQRKFEMCPLEDIENSGPDTNIDDFINDIVINPIIQHDDLIDVDELNNTHDQTFFDPNNVEGYDIGAEIGIQRTQIEVFLPNKEISYEQYCSTVRDLNSEQKAFFYHILHQAKTSLTPFHTFLSGGAGVGKSVTIRSIYQALTKFYGHQQNAQPDKIHVLLCAPTGKAAHNIGGNTIHSTFCIPVSQGFQFKPLDMQQLNTMRALYHELKVVIIDEISMVGRGMFNFINLRLQEVMGNIRPFGGISILAVGDLFQLKPVMDAWLFSDAYQSVNMNCLATNQWVEQFDFFELKQVMRQKDDRNFALLLNRLREGKHNEEDINVLKKRVITNLDTEISSLKSLPHLFSTKKDVCAHNQSVLNELSADKKIVIEAIDSVSGDLASSVKENILTKIPRDCSKTMGLEKELELGCGLPTELCLNVDVDDGLTNGAGGIIRKFDCRKVGSNRCSIVWVEFEDESVGHLWRLKYKHLYLDGIELSWTPIFEVTRKFTYHFFKTYLIVRRQFPLRMSSGKTIHKAQGSTMKSLVVNFGNRKIDHIHYVALSRVTSISQLYLVGFNPEKITLSDAVLWEMERLRTTKSLVNSIPDLTQTSPTHCTLCFQNCRSLRRHIEDIRRESNLLEADLVCFVETRTTRTQENNTDIEGKYLKNSSFDECAHGIAVYSRNEQALENVNFSTVLDIETALVSLRSNEIIAFIYCPPKRATLNNIQAFFSYLLHSYGATKRIIVIGDFNFNPCNNRTPDVQQFYPFTRILFTVTTDYGSCLDHIYISSDTFDIETTGTLESYYSDHKPIFVIYRC